jgi:hypothetical protein
LTPNNHEVALSRLEIGCSRTSHVTGPHRATDPDLRRRIAGKVAPTAFGIAARGPTIPAGGGRLRHGR